MSEQPPDQTPDQVPDQIPDVEQRVLVAVETLETAGEPGYLAHVARGAALEEDGALAALSALSDRGLVSRVDGPDAGGADLGPRWLQRPGS